MHFNAVCAIAGAGLSPKVSTVLTYTSGLREVSKFLSIRIDEPVYLVQVSRCDGTSSICVREHSISSLTCRTKG